MKLSYWNHSIWANPEDKTEFNSFYSFYSQYAEQHKE